MGMGGAALRWTAIALVAAAGLTACVPRQPAGPAVLAERYCYRTLGVVDCHAAPLPGEDYRRVGFFDTPIAIIPAAGS